MRKVGATALFLMSFNALADDTPAQACQQSLRAGELTKAIAFAQQAIKSNAGEREGYLCLGRAQGQAGDYAAAIAALQVADRQSNSPIEHMQALTLLGHQQKALKANAEARASYQKSLELARQDRNKFFQRVNLMGVGEIQQAEGDFKGALESYQQGAKLAANDNERADCHAHLAAAYHALGDHDQTIAQQVKAVIMEERSGELDHYAQASLTLSQYYLDAGQYANAEKALGKLLSVVTQAGDAYWEASVYQLQARLKRAQNQVAESDQLLQRALQLANKIGASELAKEIEAGSKL